MKNFLAIGTIDTMPLLMEVLRQPELFQPQWGTSAVLYRKK